MAASRLRSGQDGGLFDAAAEEAVRAGAPLAARMRPRKLGEIVGQRHLLGPGGPLDQMAGEGRVRSFILWGPPGCGKTTIAKVLAAEVGASFEAVPATSSGVAELRAALERARRLLAESDRRSILFVDEVHRFSRPQQEVLLPAVEEGLVAFVGATTENPFFSLTGALTSRVSLYRLESLGLGELREILARALSDQGAAATEEAAELLCSLAAGDARALLVAAEAALATARLRASASGRPAAVTIGIEDAESARVDLSLKGGADAHYDMASAFIKSIRGSDPDAGLYWLARMLAVGEDPFFIARRLVILASEDVGMADPQALSVATAAATALQLVGLPEGALNLAQAVVHLALAPKSNSVTAALGAASADAAACPTGVPAHLRDAHYRSAATLGHGDGYRYPHDYPGAWVPQQYRPEAVEGHSYYVPKDQGAEAELSRAVHERREREASR